MRVYEFEAFESFTLAMVALFVGRWVIGKISLLRRFSIPDSVIGGFGVAAIVALFYYLFKTEVVFDLDVRDSLLLYFFAIIGLKSDVKTLISGGKPLVILTVLAGAFIVAQNGVAMAVAALFGMDPKAGLMTGSVSLTGGVGTALAWAPRFVEELGIANALEIGLAGNMMGLIAACVIGGPIASFLNQSIPTPRHRGGRPGCGDHPSARARADRRLRLLVGVALGQCCGADRC